MSHEALDSRSGLPAATPDGTREVPFRGGGFRHRPLGLIGPLVFIVLIVLWELG